MLTQDTIIKTAGDEIIGEEYQFLFLEGFRRFPNEEDDGTRRSFWRENQVPPWAVSRMMTNWARMAPAAREGMLREGD